MIITEKTKEICDKIVAANFINRKNVVGPSHEQERCKILKRYCQGANKILDVGCGGYMPVYLAATHACDLSKYSHSFMTSLGWKGEFKIASCDDLPYPDKYFDVAVCSEVIEHLPDLESVRKTFKEINRVAWKWIITTPAASRSGFRDRWNIEPTHVQFFTVQDLINLAAPIIVDIKVVEEVKVRHAFITKRL